MPQVLSPEQEGLPICLLLPALFNKIPERAPSQYCICSETQECDLRQQHTCPESLALCRSVRACISKNGSYSRQAELRLLQGLYPEASSQQQHAAGRDRGSRQRQGGQDGGGWSSDEDGDAENAMPPVHNTGQHTHSHLPPKVTVKAPDLLPRSTQSISRRC